MAALPKSDTLPIAPTRAAQEMNPNEGIVHLHGEPLVSASDVYEDRPEGYDFLYVSDAEAQSFGINTETHIPVWIRNPKMWMEHEKKDRVKDFLSVGGRMVPRLRNGEFICNGDLILAARSRKEEERNAELEAREQRQYLKGTEEGGNLAEIPRYEKGSKVKTAEDSMQEHLRNMADGIIGPTKGRSYLDVIRNNPEAYDRDREFFRMGNYHADLDDAGEERAARARQELNESQDNRGGFVKGSIPKNVRPKNFMGAKK